jgi:hemerythrin
MYEMKEEYKIGVQQIDEQHERLFNLANEAYLLLKDQLSIDKYDKIINIIEELKEYTIFHFKSEEEYMESIDYKRIFSQMVEHHKFIEKLESIDLRHLDEDQDKGLANILEFLNNWLIEHILKDDKLIKG